MNNRILIVDDESPAIEKIVRFLKRIDYSWDISTATNGVEGIRLLETNVYDIILLDIQMPQMNAFEMLQQLKLEKLPPLIFCTAYDQYALQAFEIHAVDYLLKPFHFERFEKSFTRVIQLQKAENDKELRFKHAAPMGISTRNN